MYARKLVPIDGRPPSGRGPCDASDLARGRWRGFDRLAGVSRARAVPRESPVPVPPERPQGAKA